MAVDGAAAPGRCGGSGEPCGGTARARSHAARHGNRSGAIRGAPTRTSGCSIAGCRRLRRPSPRSIIDPPDSSWLGARGAGRKRSRPGGRARPSRPGRRRTVPRTGGPASSRRSTDAASRRGVGARHAADQHRGGAGPLCGARVLDAGAELRVHTGISRSRRQRVDWLGRPERGVRHQPGHVNLPPSTRRIVRPTASALPLTTFDDRVSATLPAPGLYLAESAAGQRVLTVALDNPARSNLMSSTLPENRSVPQRSPEGGSRGGSTARRRPSCWRRSSGSRGAGG